MNIVTPQVGIDVAKDSLDVSIDGARCFRVKNDESGCLCLAERLGRACVVHLESSGGYERLAVRTLRAYGIQVGVHDPLKAKRLFQATGFKAKTDALDARSLAKLGSLLEERKPKSLEREGLCDCSRAIEALKTSAAEFLVRAKASELDPTAKAAYLAAAKGLKEQAKALEKRFEARVKASTFAERYRLALSVPGAGKTLARLCVCELPDDLSPYEAKQIACYAGLAPIDDSSGSRTKRPRLGRGNVRLKSGTYMPALSAMRSQSWARDLYARLRAKGRLHQQAIVAVMRRLLVRVVAVLKRGTPWQEVPPKT